MHLTDLCLRLIFLHLQQLIHSSVYLFLCIYIDTDIATVKNWLMFIVNLQLFFSLSVICHTMQYIAYAWWLVKNDTWYKRAWNRYRNMQNGRNMDHGSLVRCIQYTCIMIMFLSWRVFIAAVCSCHHRHHTTL